MNYKRIIAGVFLIVSVISLSAFIKIDDDPISKIAAQLEKWFTDNPQEKVYLQLDKPCYAIGDDIWFKAYITTGPNHELSGISGVLNVELIDDKDSVKQSLKLPVLSGLTWGDFSLADTLKEGNYRVRAYTNWMRNAGDEYFFEKTVSIVNSIKNNVFTRANYTYSTQNGQQKVSSFINYVDLNGAPYENAQVSYEIQLNAKTINKGKGQTDDKGNLNISFINSAPDLLKSGRIITGIKLPDKTIVTKSVLIKAASDKVDIQFFPEGGNLVIGNYSKVAFKAVAADGLGTDVKGILTDEQNNQVATFSSSHLGMGIFYFKPENGKNYKAKLTYADGSENTVSIPNAVNTGYSLSINNSDSVNIHVKIIPGPAVTQAVESPIMCLVAQAGGVIYYAGKSKPGSAFFTAVIPKNKFPSGIVQFTLLSPTGEPMNERLVFVQNHDQLRLDVSSEKQSYAPRQKVKIDLNAKNENDKPMPGSFSVAVTDEATVPVNENDENTILSNLLLTSDLKGYIEKPDYYFSGTNQKTEADLDMLMLTQGYHRFEWKQIEDNSYPPATFKAEKALEISGHIKTLGGKPIANGKVTLFTTTDGGFLLNTVSDNNGIFSFKNLLFKDSVKFVVQGRTAKDRKSLQIDVDNEPGKPKTDKNKYAPDMQVNAGNALFPFLQNSKAQYTGQLKYGIVNNAIQLKEVVIADKKVSALKDSQNLNGPGNADEVVLGDDLEKLGCPIITDCLQAKLGGITFRNGMPYLARSLDRPTLIIVDGVKVDAHFLSNLSGSDIESVELLKNIGYTAVYGGQASGGVLVITLRRGGSDNTVQRYAPGVITYSPKGFHKIREFYSPQYDNPKTNTLVPDLRSTIYWRPNVVTGKDGKASIEFFNADSKGRYRVVVEGIDEDGNIGRQVYHYKVD